MAERDLQGSIVRWLNTQHCTVARVNGPGPAHVVGDPDIYGCCAGGMFVIECKSAVGCTSQTQEFRLDEWRKAGASTLVARSLKAVKEWYENMYGDRDP
jgi:Holliday junction resolvase